MDVFMVYLLVASATPLFLWVERRKLALLQLPFIALMWVYSVLYMTTDLSMWSYSLFAALFIGNVLFAHYAAFLIFIAPAVKQLKNKPNATNVE